MSDEQQRDPQRRRWGLGFSGGGLRSCASSAVFCLAAMQTPCPALSFPEEEEEVSHRRATTTTARATAARATTATNNDDGDDDGDDDGRDAHVSNNNRATTTARQGQQQRSEEEGEEDNQHSYGHQCLWEQFFRVVGVSGGSWFLAAFCTGILQHITASITIDDLLDLLQVSSIVSSGSIDQRHDQLSAHLASRLPQWHENQDRFVRALASPFASAINRNFGEAAVIALTSHSPLSDYQKYLEQRLYIDENVEFCSIPQRKFVCCDDVHDDVIDHDNNHDYNTNGGVAAAALMVNNVVDNKTRHLLMARRREEEEDESDRSLNQNCRGGGDQSIDNNSRVAAPTTTTTTSRRSRRRTASRHRRPELWMTCIAEPQHDGRLRQPNAVKEKLQQLPHLVETNSEQTTATTSGINNIDSGAAAAAPAADGGVEQQQQQLEQVATASSWAFKSCWLAFSISAPNTVHLIPSDSESIEFFSSSSSSNLAAAGKTELVPLEPLPLSRICAFCGSAFSASFANVADHMSAGKATSLVNYGSALWDRVKSAATEGLSSAFESAKATIASSTSSSVVVQSVIPATSVLDDDDHHHQSYSTTSNNNHNNNNSGCDDTQQQHSPVLGEGTVDTIMFSTTSGDIALNLRDAGLECNIPFLFLEQQKGGGDSDSASSNDVTFVLDSGSNTRVGKQIRVAQRKGLLGRYTGVYSSLLEEVVVRRRKQQREQDEEQDEEEGGNTTDNSNATSSDDNRVLEEALISEKQKRQEKSGDNTNNSSKNNDSVNHLTWQIFLKDSGRGPNVIVYVLGLTDAETMEVTSPFSRLQRLRLLYELYKKELPVIVRWLVERGF